MGHGGKRPGAGRKPSVSRVEKPRSDAVQAPVVTPSRPDEPAEPDWSLLFTDELDLAVARRQWGLLVADLRSSEKLASANESHLRRVVFHQVVWERAARQIAEHGAVIKKRRGPGKPNPWFSILKDANAMVSAAEAELTITPRRRSNGGKVSKKKPSEIGGGYLRVVK